MSYITTYSQAYRKKAISYVKPAKLTYEEFDDLPEGGNWLETKLDVKSGLEVAMLKINEMYKKRYVTAYQEQFPWKTASSPTKIYSDADVKDELLETCYKIKYEKNNQALLPPLTGARIIFGYMNPTYFQTGHSSYDVEYGRYACEQIYGKRLEKQRNFLEHQQRQAALGQDNEYLKKDAEEVAHEKSPRKHIKCKCKLSKQ